VFRFRYTDLSQDSGQPWFVAHVIDEVPLPNGNERKWTGYGESLMLAVVAALNVQDEELTKELVS
jgi:hypothetical protein